MTGSLSGSRLGRRVESDASIGTRFPRENVRPCTMSPVMAKPRQHDGSRRYHDRVARQYDAIYDDPYWAFHDELTWRLIKPHVPNDLSAQVCDLGCGTGKWGVRLLKSGFATTFVDSSGAMIEQTRAKTDAM